MSSHSILKQYWGYEDFRPLQEEIVNSVLENRDTLTLLPTGGGKSICYQVPAMMKEGVCIVVSPLIALIKDQVEDLRNKNIPAEYLISGMNRRECDTILDNCIFGNRKFLYLSPERLTDETVRARIMRMKVSLLAVDEAHCISQWGYDFRPSYLQIAEIKEHIPGVPLLALTATATKVVAQDIIDKLGLLNCNVFQSSFERKNLSYSVFKENNKHAKLLEIASKVNGQGIVYVKNRRKTKELTMFLRNNNISATFYHGGLSAQIRDAAQNEWMHRKSRIMVATNAFGMGINKPDVRFVVHYDIPDSLEAYYQEAGRAGRDGLKSYAVALYEDFDRTEAEKRLEMNFPEIDEIKRIYHALGNYFQLAHGSGKGESFDFDMQEFCGSFKLHPSIVHSGLKLLESEGYISSTEAIYNPSKFKFLVNNFQLYEYMVRNPQLDTFIKGLLRSFEGIFDDYKRIIEKDFAKRVDITEEKCISILKQLAKEGVIDYLPKTDSPRINYLQERIDEKHLLISKEKLELRKKNYKDKLEATFNYLTETLVCRTKLLVTYFGETYDKKCGVCDVCLGRTTSELTSQTVSDIHEQIKKHLSLQPQDTRELVEKVKGYSPDQVLNTLRLLIDNGEVLVSESNKLSLKTVS